MIVAPSRRRLVALCLILLGLAAIPAERAAAVTHLKRGMPAPPVKLPDLRGQAIDTEAMRPRTVVLVFGELYHEKTMAMCEAVQTALGGAKFVDKPITAMLVVAQRAPAEALRVRTVDAGLRWRVLHDVERRVFGAYRVTVMPSAVVIDGQGRVVHALAGATGRFADIVTDAVLVSTGELSYEQFARALHPAAEAAASEALKRATRLTSLARQLVRRDLPELAEEKYTEALETVPGHVPARLGLGMLKLQQGRIAEAELEFRAVLAGRPKSVDARLGLAYLQTLRGGEELGEAEVLVREVRASNPNEARAHYLLGLIQQQRNETEDAVASFRAAAELLMSQRVAWDVVPTEQPSNEAGNDTRQ